MVTSVSIGPGKQIAGQPVIYEATLDDVALMSKDKTFLPISFRTPSLMTQ